MKFSTSEQFYTEILQKQYPDTRYFTQNEKKEIKKNLKKIHDILFSENVEFSVNNILFCESYFELLHIIYINLSNGFNRELMYNYFKCFVRIFEVENLIDVFFIYLTNLSNIFFEEKITFYEFLGGF